MRTIYGTSVPEAFALGYNLLCHSGREEQSRNGPVLKHPTPVTIVYPYPQRRVLFDPIRDHNPFFALFESLWMLAGREDLAYLTQFNKAMAQYSDDGVTVRGSAYGKRWRSWFGYDQIQYVLNALADDPTSRRCVLTMWDASDDPLVSSKDIPCNTQIYFDVDVEQKVLNMMVTNRSNDLVFGALGSNAVHFSILLEYMASHLGLGVGTYYQVTNNLHLYTDNPVVKRLGSAYGRQMPIFDPYDMGMDVYPLFDQDVSPKHWEDDLHHFFDETVPVKTYKHSFFSRVCEPMKFAHQLWREGKKPVEKYEPALRVLSNIPAEDWKAATMDWMNRRKQKLMEGGSHAESSPRSANLGS